jgi:hypothetical protein
MKRWFAILVLLSAVPLLAQQSPPPATPDAAQPSVRFSFDWPQGYPWQSYSITVWSDGKTHFNGTPHADETNDTEPYRQDFVISDANRQKVFALAAKLNYFQADVDSHLKHIAQTGKKTLQYRSPQIQGSATYNWSLNADVQELTRMFAAIAMTIEFGRKLAFQYRYDKLGMDERLKQLEELQASHGVEELQVLSGMLHKIANDPNLMNISRQSAQRLLLSIGGTSSSVQTPGPQ